MKLKAIKLKELLRAKNVKVTELVEAINALQRIALPSARPMTRQAVYFYFNGHTPPQERIYMICALLDTHPKDIFEVEYDEDKYKEYRELIQKNFNI